jgi:glutamate/tyrosine decarboxylase-like PLP-dependent enzyme
VDAAWGGAAALVPELKPLLSGIELADSITFDAHKFLSIPMGAGLYITRHPGALDRIFSTQASYMPKEGAGLDVVEPHLHSMQWSRRFIGLKLFLTLAVAGWNGYEETIRRQTALGDLLRQLLRANGWEIVNRTPLPVVCFDKPGIDAHQIAMRIVETGKAWISSAVLGGSRTVLRACITNFRTEPGDVHALVKLLN